MKWWTTFADTDLLVVVAVDQPYQRASYSMTTAIRRLERGHYDLSYVHLGHAIKLTVYGETAVLPGPPSPAWSSDIPFDYPQRLATSEPGKFAKTTVQGPSGPVSIWAPTFGSSPIAVPSLDFHTQPPPEYASLFRGAGVADYLAGRNELRVLLEQASVDPDGTQLDINTRAHERSRVVVLPDRTLVWDLLAASHPGFAAQDARERLGLQGPNWKSIRESAEFREAVGTAGTASALVCLGWRGAAFVRLAARPTRRVRRKPCTVSGCTTMIPLNAKYCAVHRAEQEQQQTNARVRKSRQKKRQ